MPLKSSCLLLLVTLPLNVILYQYAFLCSCVFSFFLTFLTIALCIAVWLSYFGLPKQSVASVQPTG